MLAQLRTFALMGIDAVPVEVEVDTAPANMPKTILVGLPELTVRESIHRIERAMVNLGYRLPTGRTVINLAPADLRKDAGRIEAAYNDARGVTAEFNRNMLLVLNQELGADFDPSAFEHRAFYEPESHWIEMHLVARGRQLVTIPGIGVVRFEAGESLRTEISC